MARLLVFQGAQAELRHVVEVCVLQSTLLHKVTATHSKPGVLPSELVRVFATRGQPWVGLVHTATTLLLLT